MDDFPAVRWALVLLLWGAAFFWAQRAFRVGVFRQTQFIRANGMQLPHPEELLNAYAWMHSMTAIGLAGTAFIMTFIGLPFRPMALLVILSMLPTSLGALLHAARQFKKYPPAPEPVMEKAADPALTRATSVAIVCPQCRATNRESTHCFRCGDRLENAGA